MNRVNLVNGADCMEEDADEDSNYNGNSHGNNRVGKEGEDKAEIIQVSN